ncbi:glycosyltransferase family 87 protein [Bradyrhizobium sp. CB3481]|uniref:glycosyltransferase family 87 protein n=1 Tax=Bradyrhizobium sp. CB3481 TaxID=3039158 RepID=UPI0024B1DF16|nr:glycosyltransferase family 87 protein [Bradyrhizobium sp. CB3481]WFU17270.1 glycosyltransferase family 87 protein [Bradyrhizobium sp. CB3481]
MDLAQGGGTFGQKNALHPPAVVLIPSLLLSFYVWLVLATTIPYPGKIGLDYNTLGTDWMVFYGAIRSVLDGNALLIFDGDRFTDFLNTAFAGWLSSPLDFRPWAYPPSFLLMLLPFAPLGFFGSYVAFQIVSGALLALALRSSAKAALPPGALLAAVLICPASAVNVIDGQAVFLVAALIVGGFSLLERHPHLAGLILGLLTFKPQFCILVPIALIAAGQWRALVASGLSALVLMIAGGLVFGWDLWLRWFPVIFENLVSPNEKWIEFGRMWGHSVYTCAVLLGAPDRLASLIQLLATLGAAISVVIAFRSRLGTREKTAVFLAATVLAAPHSGPYDGTLLAIAAAFWLMARSAPLPLWCWTLAFMIWLLPMLSPPLLFPVARIAPLFPVMLIVLLLRPAAPATSAMAPSPAG